VKGVEMKGGGSGWSRHTCQLHTGYNVKKPRKVGYMGLIAIPLKSSQVTDFVRQSFIFGTVTI